MYGTFAVETVAGGTVITGQLAFRSTFSATDPTPADFTLLFTAHNDRNRESCRAQVDRSSQRELRDARVPSDTRVTS